MKNLWRIALSGFVLFFGFASAPAFPRMWKGTPDRLARDYAIIGDVRQGGAETVWLMWFVPEQVPNAENLKALLRKYVILMVVHGKLDKPTLKMSFEDVNTLEAKDQSGKSLTHIARKDLVPATTAVVATLESIFRQSLGAMGEGTKVFIFDAGAVNSCKPGSLAVPLAGETYTWQTPIPGCSASQKGADSC